jgi:Fe-S cluster assembly protein SufD
MTARDANGGQDHYLRAFAALRKQAAGRPDAWTARLRREGLERFAALGFPTQRQEEWRLTSVAPIAAVPFAVQASAAPNGVTPAMFERFTFEPWECTHMVFVNGHAIPALSRLRSFPGGVVACSLAEALARHRDLVEPHLGRLGPPGAHAFAALNTAFLQDGLFLHVPGGVVLEEPIHLLFVTSPHGRPTASFPRNLVIAERGSQAAIVESYAGLEPGDVYFTDAVSEVVVGDGAVVDHYRLQREAESAFHVALVQAEVGRAGAFHSWNVNLGGGLARNDLNAVLAGEGGECRLEGLYVAGGRQHVDNHTVIEHAAPHGASLETYKGVLDGRARGVFDGTIIVRPEAAKTDARQINKNLLLSEDALADSNPRLRILNDDVKCSHGAAIGQLDDDALFYLRSRGVPLEMARNLLIQAFVGDVVHRIPIAPIRTGLECLLFTRLHGVHRAGGRA